MTHTAAQEFVTSLVGRPAQQRTVARDAVSSSAIRTWCDAMGERSEVYLDPATARAAGYADVIAPPAMLQVWTMPGLEPDRPFTAGPSRTGDLDETVRATLADMGYSATLAATTDQEYLTTLVAGDGVSAEAEYVAVSEEKQTHLGPGFFLTHRTTYTCADASIAGRMTASVLHFAPLPAASVPPGTPPQNPPARPIAGVPVRLEPGAECGPVLVPVTPTQVIAGAMATRDFYPVHHDRDFARAHGNVDFLMNILTTNGLLARVVGEWAGQVPLVRLRTRLVAPAHVHDELIMTGRVTQVGPDRLELTVRAALASGGVHAEAVADLALPEHNQTM